MVKLGGPLRLLISDEDPDRRVNTRRAVQRANMEVVAEVGYGIQAVSTALETKPDIILLAVEEPVGRPLETAEGLGNALPHTPVIVYSSISEPRALRRAMMLGARDYLSQPVQMEQLKEAVDAVLVQEERRQMQRSGQLSEQHGRGTVVTVCGGKGGIGKSVVCVNLAVALQRETGRSVAIFDADTQLGDVATMLDLTPDRTVKAVVEHIDSLERDNITQYLTHHAEGVAVLAASGSEDTWEGWTAEGVKAIIDALARNFDFVLVDTAATFDRFVRTCIEASTLALVVTTGEVSSVRDTSAGLTRLSAWGIPADRFKLVMNQVGRSKGVGPDDVSQSLGHKIFWGIPYDKRVPEGVQLGQPVALYQENSPAARSLRTLARVVAGINNTAVQKTTPSLNGKFFGQLFGAARSKA